MEERIGDIEQVTFVDDSNGQILNRLRTHFAVAFLSFRIIRKYLKDCC